MKRNQGNRLGTQKRIVWEIRERKPGSGASSVMDGWSNRASDEGFSDVYDAYLAAQTKGYKYVVEVAYLVDEFGDVEQELDEVLYPVKPSKVTARARCCRCGERHTFRDSMAAFDWKFEHELAHNLPSCVDAYETDTAFPETKFPLRKREQLADRIVVTPLTFLEEQALPEPAPALTSIAEEED